MNELKEQLLNRIIELGVFKTGEFTLVSGAKSNFYIDGRLITLDAIGSELIAKIILKNLHKDVEAIGGPATAAIPIVSSTVLLSSILYKRNLKGFYIRPSTKKHGLSNIIEGPFDFKNKVAIVDDTITSGQSLLTSIKEIENGDGKVLQTISIFDRNEGGVEKLEKAGYRNFSIFKYNHKDNCLA